MIYTEEVRISTPYSTLFSVRQITNNNIKLNRYCNIFMMICDKDIICMLVFVFICNESLFFFFEVACMAEVPLT